MKKIKELIEKEVSAKGSPPGRKFLMGRYTILLATMGFLCTALSMPLSTNFTTFVGALASLFAIYCGGNVGDEWVSTKPKVQVVPDRRKAEPVVVSEPNKGPGPNGG
jgi:hypothetical protein